MTLEATGAVKTRAQRSTMVARDLKSKSNSQSRNCWNRLTLCSEFLGDRGPRRSGA